MKLRRVEMRIILLILGILIAFISSNYRVEVECSEEIKNAHLTDIDAIQYPTCYDIIDYSKFLLMSTILLPLALFVTSSFFIDLIGKS